eukprot:s1649_g1.t1
MEGQRVTNDKEYGVFPDPRRTQRPAPPQRFRIFGLTDVQTLVVTSSVAFFLTVCLYHLGLFRHAKAVHVLTMLALSACGAFTGINASRRFPVALGVSWACGILAGSAVGVFSYANYGFFGFSLANLRMWPSGPAAAPPTLGSASGTRTVPGQVLQTQVRARAANSSRSIDDAHSNRASPIAAAVASLAAAQTFRQCRKAKASKERGVRSICYAGDEEKEGSDKANCTERVQASVAANSGLLILAPQGSASLPNAMADHIHPKASAPQPAEAVPERAKRTVSVRCLAGSSFELEVGSAETGREVAERIAAAVGRPAGLLVLTSSGCVIDQCQLLLHQVQHDEIWYVVRRLGAGLVAMLWEHLLEKKATWCGDLARAVSDVAALNETMSLTFGFEFNQSLDGIHLPSSLQSLTFGFEFNQSLDGIPLPSNLQSLTFGDDFNQSLDGIQLPSSLQSLTFGDAFNQSLDGIHLPSSLQSLTFGESFNQSLDGIHLPRSLQSLTFGYKFNRSLEGIQLPGSLQSLTFGSRFNRSLEGIQLPSSLQSLTFGDQFHQSLEGIPLPSSLQSLTFGVLFNQSLDGIHLPRSLQSLKFGYVFNRSLEGIQLPGSLQSLTFGDHFDQSLDGIQLPSSLQSLTFGEHFNQSLDGIQLPSSLQSLTFGHHFDQSLDGIQLPSSLQSLTFGDQFHQSLEGIQLPSSLQSLTFGEEFNQSLDGIQLPSSLQSLSFGSRFNQGLDGIQLPGSLQSLTFGYKFNRSLEGIQLPSSLQSLAFGSRFNQSLEGIQLPSSLQSLTFGYDFNQSLDGIQLPGSLQSLTFGYKFNRSLEGIQLPSSLQSLAFGSRFNQSLEGIQLPSSLQSLTFGVDFNQSLEGIQLPSSLQSLTFGERFNQSLDGIQLPGSEDFEKPFPFSAVVGQEEIKLALLLNLVDPSIGGVMISGDRGTGKSTTVRGMVRLLPDIEIVSGDVYNSHPTDVALMSEEVLARLDAGEEIKTEMRRTPFVELPLGATEEGAFEPGILARVNRGILYIDECNLLDDQLVDVLLDSAAGGVNTVEREGVSPEPSVRHPARFVLVGTSHPDEGDLRQDASCGLLGPQLLDRFGLTCSIRTALGAEWRKEVLTRAFEWSQTPEKLEADDAFKALVLEARERLPKVKMPRALAIKISKVCSKLNVDGLRGDIVTNRTARALAALERRNEVTEEDVRRVADVVSDTINNTALVVKALLQEFDEGPPPVTPVMNLIQSVPA